MTARRQQLNIRVPEGLAKKIQMLSTFHRKSVNEWAVSTLQKAVEEEFRTHPIEGLHQELVEVAERYLPGKSLTLEEMLALAEPYAESDEGDGLQTRHVRARRK